MLSDLLNGSEKSKFLLITDDVECCGRTLLLNFLLECLKRNHNVIMKCIERKPAFYKNWLPKDVEHRMKCLECSKLSPTIVFQDIKKELKSVDNSTVIMIDSLTVPILQKSSPSVCRALHKIKLANHVSQVIALLHRDVHDEQIHHQLTHHASSVLDLEPGTNGYQECHITHCRNTGKVIKTAEVYTLDESFLLKGIQPLKRIDSNQMQTDKDTKTNQPDPTSQLTFNLSLTSNEEEARRQLVLPYLKDRSMQDNPSQSTSTIHYVADDADDFDEEDPDDDLNI